MTISVNNNKKYDSLKMSIETMLSQRVDVSNELHNKIIEMFLPDPLIDLKRLSRIFYYCQNDKTLYIRVSSNVELKKHLQFYYRIRNPNIIRSLKNFRSTITFMMSTDSIKEKLIEVGNLKTSQNFVVSNELSMFTRRELLNMIGFVGTIRHAVMHKAIILLIEHLKND